ncbi:HAD domain-containing protein [Caballeronia sp. LZ062]|uniref:HAD domain-containing protein n=1 Tax=Caballeronia sp. LZ062 TaxID=3038557 RepID=UPI003857B383
MLRLGDLLKTADNAQVVLSSSWVAQHGYRAVLGLLPSALSSRVVGATVPGNRLLRTSVREEATSRRDLLERDYLRREPDAVLVLDCDARYVPMQLRESALIIENGLWRARTETWATITERLKPLNQQRFTARKE